MFSDSKRKAVEQPDFAASIKRAKISHTVSPEKEKKPLTVVPFPEKVGRGLSKFGPQV